MRKDEGNPGTGISVVFFKSTKGVTRFNVPIAINSTYAFTSYVVRKDLGFNPCGTETRDWGSAPTSLIVSGRSLFIKNSYLVGHLTRDRCVWGSDSARAQQQQTTFQSLGWVSYSKKEIGQSLPLQIVRIRPVPRPAGLPDLNSLYVYLWGHLK